ncbi:hypothetical protein LSPCS325_19180 [Lysinibacillus sp. CTST325]
MSIKASYQGVVELNIVRWESIDNLGKKITEVRDS